MSKVIFINLPPNGVDFTDTDNVSYSKIIFPPLGIMNLACRLKSSFGSQYTVEMLNFAIEDYSLFKSIEEYIAYFDKRIAAYSGSERCYFCISLMFAPSYGLFSILAERIKAAAPESVVICGGNQATGSVEYILQNEKAVDFVVCGEGEEALPQLLAALEEGREPAIQGVSGKYGGKHYRGGMAAAIDSLDVDFTLYPSIIDMDFYTKSLQHFRVSESECETNSFPIMASRGCPCQCTFCAAGNVHGRRPRWRSIDNIRDEMLWLHEKYDVARFFIMDDNFVPKGKTLELLHMLSDLPIKNREICLQNLSVNHTDNDIIDAIAAAGIKYVGLAIETGDPEMQKRIRKNCNLDKAVDLVGYFQKKEIFVRSLYMIGFPGETVAQMHKTIEHAKSVDADWTAFAVATPLVNTAMYNEFVKLGCIEDNPKNWTATTLGNRRFDTPEISAKDIEELSYSANLEINFVENRLIRHGKYQEAIVTFQNFVNIYPFHLFGYDTLRRLFSLVNEPEKSAATFEHMKHLIRTNERARGFAPYFTLLEPEVRSAMIGELATAT